MKHIISFSIIVSCIFFLVSCGEDSPNVGLEEKVLDNITLSVPTSWPLVSKDSDGVPKPSSGEIVLIASASEPKNGFANNVVVLERKVSGITNSKEYALASKKGLEKEFYTYRELESGDIQFLDEGISHYSVFQAQYNRNTPKLNYIQTSRICNSTAYTSTITVSHLIKDFSRYIYLLSTMECKTQ